jgi:hypothetical protein
VDSPGTVRILSLYDDHNLYGNRVNQALEFIFNWIEYSRVTTFAEKEIVVSVFLLPARSCRDENMEEKGSHGRLLL